MKNYAAANVSIIIVGNKKDLDTLREVSTEEGQHAAETNGCYFLETSALDNADKMIEKVFTTLAEDIIVKKCDEDEQITTNGGQKIDLGTTNKPKAEEKKGCC